MFFASDNAGPAHPSIAEALVHANTGYQMPYGKDTIMDQVRDRLRTIFEAPEAAIYLVATGTAANSLSLATYCQPWQTVFCSPVAHINEDECNSPEFYMGGAKLTLVGDSDKMTPAALRAAMGHDARIAVSAIAADLGQPTHLDGARFANALVALGCTPAEMTWKAGVDVVSFGGTKNGCVGVEAVIFFDPAKAWEFELRRKRGAHLFSKHRYLSAQMLAYLEGGLWLDLAKRSNARMALLADGLRKIPGTSFLHDPQANIVFANLPRAAHKRLMQAGARYYLTSGDLDGADEDELLTARLVCDWSLPEAEITRFLEIAAG